MATAKQVNHTLLTLTNNGKGYEGYEVWRVKGDDKGCLVEADRY
jgi:hypothetical protein